MPTRCLTHRELLQAVWGPDYGDQVDYLRVFVNQLRKKIEPKPSNPVYLLTEPWVGYRLYLPTESALGGTPIALHVSECLTAAAVSPDISAVRGE